MGRPLTKRVAVTWCYLDTSDLFSGEEHDVFSIDAPLAEKMVRRFREGNKSEIIFDPTFGLIFRSLESKCCLLGKSFVLDDIIDMHLDPFDDDDD